MPNVEPPMPSGRDGALAQDQARVRAISARLFEEYIRHLDRSPRKVADRLEELGYFGRGGERYNDSTVIGWRKGEYAPSAWVLIAAILDAGLSFDEIAYGSGMRAEVERLREAAATSDRSLARLQRDVEMLAGVVTRHVQLDPDATQDVSRIGRRDQEPG